MTNTIESTSFANQGFNCDFSNSGFECNIYGGMISNTSSTLKPGKYFVFTLTMVLTSLILW